MQVNGLANEFIHKQFQKVFFVTNFFLYFYEKLVTIEHF